MTDAYLDALVFWYSRRDRCPCCGGELRVESVREACRICHHQRTTGVLATAHHDPRQDILDLLVECDRQKAAKPADVRQEQGGAIVDMARLEELHAEMQRGLAEDGGNWPVYTGDGE